MFLQIQGIKKSFGAGDNRVDVLKVTSIGTDNLVRLIL